jgi:hypothetical protein
MAFTIAATGRPGGAASPNGPPECKASNTCTVAYSVARAFSSGSNHPPLTPRIDEAAQVLAAANSPLVIADGARNQQQFWM